MNVLFNSIRTAMLATALSVGALGFAAPSFAQDPVTVGGAPMYANKNIIENAVNSKDHTTLVAAVKAAGLVETLSGAGPFTVFAPTNAAFGELPDGTVETLTQPAQKQQLTGILTYHVVPGRVTAAELTAKAANGGVQLTDAAGGMAMVTQADVPQSNGVVHVIDTVLMPTRS